MNKKVLWTMIVLLWVFLIGFSVVKLFFAEWFVATIENDKIVYIGSVIDQSHWLTLLADSIIGSFAIHFYLCSCKAVWKLRVVEYWLVFVYSVVIANLYNLFSTATSIIDAGCFILVPLLMGVRWKRVVAVFSAHTLGQALLLFIRSQALYLEGADYATSFILVFDVYVWLLLYYLHANMYKKEVRDHGNSRHLAFQRHVRRRAGKGACEDREEDREVGRHQNQDQGCSGAQEE